jgi:Ser/Thr protein kinase RdoA (MazF antagonist)
MVQSFMAKNRGVNYKGRFTILFLYDMCPLLGNLKNSAQYATLLRSFLAGYRSIRPLEPDHKAHIDVLIAARQATTILSLKVVWCGSDYRSHHMQEMGR